MYYTQPVLTNILRAYKIFSENFVSGVQEKNNRWLEQPLFHNPNITNVRKKVLRPCDYNIVETREVSKLKVIDIYNNLIIWLPNQLQQQSADKLSERRFHHINSQQSG